MEQIESLLSVITFILKSLNHGQIDDMDIELLKSFSLSHLAIAENLISSTDDANGSNPNQNLFYIRSNALLKISSFALEIEQEFNDFESMDTTQSVTDQINITKGPIETDLNHYRFNKEEMDKEGPNDITEPLSENTEQKDLEFVSSSFAFEGTVIIEDDGTDLTEGTVITEVEGTVINEVGGKGFNEGTVNLKDEGTVITEDDGTGITEGTVTTEGTVILEYEGTVITEGAVITEDEATVMTEVEGTVITEGTIDIDMKHHEFDNIKINEEQDLEFSKTTSKARKKKGKVDDVVFKCMFCDLDFKEEKEFHDHNIEKHLMDGMFHCVCNEAFKDKRDAEYHFMTNHTKRNRYTCSICTEFLFGKTELEEHLNNVHDKLVDPRQCSVCLDGVLYDTIKKARTHMYRKHNTVQYKCESCERFYSNSTILKKHKMQFHNGERIRIKYKCEECPKEFFNKSAYENHIAKHTGEPTFFCEKCSKKFYTAFYLQAHSYEHKYENRRFYCTQCDHSCNNKRSLRVHTVNKHLDELPFKCNSCDSRFKWKSSLKGHEMIHTGERPHKCKYCKKAFIHTSHRAKHEDIHEQNYKFLCKVCGKKYIQGGNFRLHLRTHHPNEKEV